MTTFALNSITVRWDSECLYCDSDCRNHYEHRQTGIGRRRDNLLSYFADRFYSHTEPYHHWYDCLHWLRGIRKLRRTLQRFVYCCLCVEHGSDVFVLRVMLRDLLSFFSTVKIQIYFLSFLNDNVDDHFLLNKLNLIGLNLFQIGSSGKPWIIAIYGFQIGN